jgi:periplasmic copper chaperone A
MDVMKNSLTTRMRRRLLIAAAVGGLAATSGLAGCGGDAATGSTPAASAAVLTVKDPWVKAGPAGEMTAAFGVLTNGTDADLTVTGAESPVSPMELHEMTMKDGRMVMRPKEGGFVIKAGGTHELSPGGDHLMLMKPAKAVEAGDEVSFTLRLAGGSSVTFSAIAKPFAGAGESYAPGMPMGSGAP